MSRIIAIHSFGKHTILVRWEAVISESIHSEILQFQKIIKTSFIAEIIEIVPAYNELAIYLKPEVKASAFIKKIKSLTNIPISKASEVSRREVTIPVCYEAAYAEDMALVASTNDLTEAEVIKIHSETTYTVYFLGFLPGFLYLGGLDDRLITPRRETPRAKVPKGAVAIGGSQTGVYPSSSPGGWNIIGRTPLELFSAEKKPPTLLKAGDVIKFKPILKSEFLKIQTEVVNGTYTLKTTMHD